MKITIATGLYPPEIGGPATYTVLLEKELPKRGYEVSVLAFHQSRHLPKVIRHVHFFYLAFKAALKSDILFAQDVSSVGFPSWLAAKLTGTTFFVRVPGDYAWEQSVQRYGVSEDIDTFQKKRYGLRVQFLRFIQSTVTRFADKVVTPSNYFRLLVIGWGVPESKVHAIYNGVDLNKEASAVDKPGRLTMVTAGRLVPWKGFSEVIKMMKSLPDWHLVILGDGPDKESLIELTEELSLESRVHLLGNVTRDEVFSWCSAADAFILNTRFESFSYQIVEAMCSGTPVITTNVGSLPELITSGEDGVLVEYNDMSAMLEAVKTIILNKTKWSEMTLASQKKAQKFSIEKTMDSLDKLIKSHQNG